MSFEKTILSHLVHNHDFARKTIPFLKAEYFHDSAERTVFEAIDSYTAKFLSPPSKEALSVDLASKEGLDQDRFERVGEIVDNLEYDATTQEEWLLEKTEKFCQDKAVYNAIMESIQILDDKTGKLAKGTIPKILSDALGVSFDTHIGHDFIEDAEARFEFYHAIEDRIPFDLEMLNKITKGGLPRKTLNVIMGSTGTGKSLVMCHMAASNLMKGKNVLYITLEMAEERIAERIDANLLDVTIDELSTMTKESYDKKMARLKSKTVGKLVVKEYPTCTAGSANFRHLLGELKLKKKFVPDIIYIDYINICMSSRLKMNSANMNSYTYVKAIAEEIRALAIEFNLPIVSATQTNRGGFDNSDISMSDTSECVYVKEKIALRDGTVKEIGDVEVGDQVTSHDLYKTVMFVHHPKKKDCIKLTLKSGKQIIVSKQHAFPTSKGRLSYDDGLAVGNKLAST